MKGEGSDGFQKLYIYTEGGWRKEGGERECGEALLRWPDQAGRTSGSPKRQLWTRWSCLRTGYRFTEIEVLPHRRAQESRRHGRRLVRRIVPLVHRIIVVIVVLVGVERLRPLRHLAASTATRTTYKKQLSAVRLCTLDKIGKILKLFKCHLNRLETCGIIWSQIKFAELAKFLKINFFLLKIPWTEEQFKFWIFKHSALNS